MSLSYLTIWRAVFSGYKVLCLQFFLSYFEDSFHCLLALTVNVEMLAVSPNFAPLKALCLWPSCCFYDFTIFWHFYYDKTWSDFLCIFPSWCSACFLNLWLDVHEFGEILSHYLFKYCSCPFLSISSFWDFCYLYVRPFPPCPLRFLWFHLYFLPLVSLHSSACILSHWSIFLFAKPFLSTVSNVLLNMFMEFLISCFAFSSSRDFNFFHSVLFSAETLYAVNYFLEHINYSHFKVNLWQPQYLDLLGSASFVLLLFCSLA